MTQPLTIFTSGSRPNLQKLSFATIELDVEAAAALGGGQWPLLKVLQLSECRLAAAALSKIILGCWPELQRIYLGCSEYGPAELAAVSGASRKIVQEGTNHGKNCTRLAAGRWPALELLELSNVIPQDAMCL